MTSQSQTTIGAFPYGPLTQPMPQAAFPQTVTQIPQRPTYYPQFLYWYPSPPVSPPTPQSTPTTPAISYYTTSNTNNQAGPYTGPCMIIMRGLPINVSIQDIMNYFQGFPEVRLGFIEKDRNNIGTRVELKILIYIKCMTSTK